MSNGIGIDEQGSVKLEGDSDGTLIGNVGDALKVTNVGEIFVESIPHTHEIRMLIDGSSIQDMNKDGSSTAIEYAIGPAAGETWYCKLLAWTFADTSAAKLDGFGGIVGGLTNGVLIETQVNSNDYVIHNFKQNFMIAAHFSEISNFAGGNSGFINDANFFTGSLSLDTPPTTLIGDDGDKIKVSIRDNLVGINFFRIGLHYWRHI